MNFVSRTIIFRLTSLLISVYATPWKVLTVAC